MTRKIKDLEGEKVGMLTAIESNHKEGVRGWNCQCECGEIIKSSHGQTEISGTAVEYLNNCKFDKKSDEVKKTNAL